MRLNTKKVVITGAPGTGKTSIINDLENKGFWCFHEIIRDMTSEAKMNGESDEFISNPLLFVDDAMQFNKDLLYGRAKHHEESQRLNVPLSFFDRGDPDVLAYMDFFEQAYGEDFITACKKYRYNAIFIVPPWKEIYISDNERLETFEEAEKIHDALIKTYTTFGYEPILVPKKPVEQRTTFILDLLNNN